jgi:hypothetical protein
MVGIPVNPSAKGNKLKAYRCLNDDVCLSSQVSTLTSKGRRTILIMLPEAYVVALPAAGLTGPFALELACQANEFSKHLRKVSCCIFFWMTAFDLIRQLLFQGLKRGGMFLSPRRIKRNTAQLGFGATTTAVVA